MMKKWDFVHPLGGESKKNYFLLPPDIFFKRTYSYLTSQKIKCNTFKKIFKIIYFFRLKQY